MSFIYIALFFYIQFIYAIPCKPGSSIPCYEGSLETAHKSPCKMGVQFCTPESTWSPCRCQVLPQKEVCDGIDNDCNGQIDEGCKCLPYPYAPPRRCSSVPLGPSGQLEGICREGIQICDEYGNWSSCMGAIEATKEVCDGVDNDCNGQVDEGCLPCSHGQYQTCFFAPTRHQNVGICRSGTQICQNGLWGSCIGQVVPTIEICDNLDNDCDGQVDNVLKKVCGSGIGECKQGFQDCKAGKWGSCIGEVKPQVEICDCKDNDCNGLIDDQAYCPAGQMCQNGYCYPKEPRLLERGKGEEPYSSEGQREPSLYQDNRDTMNTKEEDRDLEDLLLREKREEPYSSEGQGESSLYWDNRDIMNAKEEEKGKLESLFLQESEFHFDPLSELHHSLPLDQEAFSESFIQQDKKFLDDNISEIEPKGCQCSSNSQAFFTWLFCFVLLCLCSMGPLKC